MSEEPFDECEEPMAEPTEHWGECLDRRQQEYETLSLDFRKLLVQGAMDMDTNRPDSVPYGMYDPANDNAYSIKLPSAVSAMDEVVLHSLKLHRYIEDMERLIQDVTDSNDIDDLNPPSVPPVPERGPAFQRLPMVALSGENARYLLRKSCATIACHAGYSTAKTAVLDTLTDVAERYLRCFAARIRTAMDQTARTGPSGFSYPLLRALAETGVDLQALGNNYHAHVRKDNVAMYKSAQLLYDQCADLVGSKVRERVKERQEKGELEEENIPELHFPALGEDQLQSSLEPGFQMLDSLEHDESLQNMEADEEIVVNDSPSHEYVHSTSSDFSSPTESQNRVKRRKLV